MRSTAFAALVAGAIPVAFHVIHYMRRREWSNEGNTAAMKMSILSSPRCGPTLALLLSMVIAAAPAAADDFSQTELASFAQEAYVKASNTEAGDQPGFEDQFGWSVAISGDTMVVGAVFEDSNARGVNGNQNNHDGLASGAAYVFVRSGTAWSQQAYLKASNADPGDAFGISVAISGDTIVVGAFTEDSSATGVDGNQADNSVLASGAAYVFVRSGTTWSQQAYLKASNTASGNLFGNSVAISGDTIVVGAFQEGFEQVGGDQEAPGSGAAYVFERTGTTWSPQAYLKASNAEDQDFFGGSVAISGNTIVVGAYQEESAATGVDGNQGDNSLAAAGAAYVFVRSGTTWSQQAYLKASNTGATDSFGIAVAIAGNTIAVGAFGESSNATGVNGNQLDDSAFAAGAVYVFVRSATTWSQQAYLKASNTDAGDFFGTNVAVSGDVLVVGAIGERSRATGVDGNQLDNSVHSGAAYVFERAGTAWSQQAYLKASNTEQPPFAALPGDYFGFRVAISDDTLVVGAPFEDSDARGVNGNQASNSATDSGAAYVFRFAAGEDDPPPPPGAWLQTPALPGFRFKVLIDADRTGAQVADCVPQTLCIAGAIPTRAELFVRIIGPRPNGKLWAQAVRFTVSQVELWIEQTSSETVNYYRLEALPSSTNVLTGVNDSLAFDPSGSQLGVDSATRSGVAYAFSSEKADPAPPAGAWLTTPAVPGFRFKVLIDGSRTGTQVADCVPGTLCIAGAIPTRAELFVRIIGPRPNGKLWAQAVRFTISRVEVWIEQTSSAEVRYYQLAALPPSTDTLSGVNDSLAFTP